MFEVYMLLYLKVDSGGGNNKKSKKRPARMPAKRRVAAELSLRDSESHSQAHASHQNTQIMNHSKMSADDSKHNDPPAKCNHCLPY
jgi:hypothetical protein